jgi:hypothetical protein
VLNGSIPVDVDVERDAVVEYGIALEEEVEVVERE